MTTTTNDRAPTVSAGEGRALWFLANRMTIKATGEDTDGRYSLSEAVVAPGFATPVHIHHREEEAFYVLEGHLRVGCGGERIDARAGSYVLLPRDVPHWFANVGDAPARMLNIMSPAGGEGFFAEAGRPAEAEGLPPAGPPDIDALHRAGPKYGVEMVGPPPAAALTER